MSDSDQDNEDIRAQIKTPQFDPRFPNSNQTLNCFVNYVDYHRCVDLLKGENAEKCEVFKKIFTSICPYGWVSHWDDMRESGTFPLKVVRVPDPENTE